MFEKVRPEKFFLFSGLIAGLLLCFLIPIGAGYDEDTHVARIWEISHGNLIPNSLLYTGPNFPSVFYELSYRQKNFLDPVSLHFIADNFNRHIDWNNMIVHSTRSLYNPLLYIVQGFIMGLLGRLFNAPVLLIYYLCRISYLLLYISLTYLAIKIIPLGKWVLVTLALAPMAMTQAVDISADPITNAVCFLFLAYILYLRFTQKLITRKDIWIILLMLALLFIVKINGIVLMLALFLLVGKKFESKSLRIQLIVGSTFLFLTLVVGWNLLAFSLRRPFLVEPGVDPVGQAKFILTQPINFLTIILDNLSKYSGAFIKEWIGVMGYRYWAYPVILYILFLLLLVFGFIAEERPKYGFTKRDRFVLISAFIIGILVTLSSLYLLYNPVGSAIINRDGRYLIPLFPLFIFGIYPTISFKLVNYKSILVIGNIALLFIVTVSVFFSYYVSCGVYYYTSPGQCFYPIYKNWMPNQKFINEDKSVIAIDQSFQSECATIDQMRFWVKGDNRSQTSYTFKLMDVKSKQVIAIQNSETTIKSEADWAIVKFPPQQDQYLRFLEFKILPLEGSTLPAFAVSTRDENTSADLSLNGISQPFDLLYQYHCQQNLGQDLKNLVN